jgi:hypothetical protein
MFEPLKDPSFFRRVRVEEEAGTIAWPNGLGLDPDVLHGDYPPEWPGLHDLDQRAVPTARPYEPVPFSLCLSLRSPDRQGLPAACQHPIQREDRPQPGDLAGGPVGRRGDHSVRRNCPGLA